jgi:hypothetical protein
MDIVKELETSNQDDLEMLRLTLPKIVGSGDNITQESLVLVMIGLLKNQMSIKAALVELLKSSTPQQSCETDQS